MCITAVKLNDKHTRSLIVFPGLVLTTARQAAPLGPATSAPTDFPRRCANPQAAHDLPSTRDGRHSCGEVDSPCGRTNRVAVLGLEGC